MTNPVIFLTSSVIASQGTLRTKKTVVSRQIHAYSGQIKYY